MLITAIQDEVAAAEPSIDEKTANLVSKGRWSVPGYKVSFIKSVTTLEMAWELTRFTGKIWRSLPAIDCLQRAPSLCVR